MPDLLTASFAPRWARCHNSQTARLHQTNPSANLCELALQSHQLFLVSCLHQLIHQSGLVTQATGILFWQAARPSSLGTSIGQHLDDSRVVGHHVRFVKRGLPPNILCVDVCAGIDQRHENRRVVVDQGRPVQRRSLC
ncbi:hypothetical protein DFP92_102354 [Yoonia sediminilitoris]|uniref:Uncharacterized protein n=1 Tax=Yoonia sediminilitoris TaxID=1286148 RepID=A0A2T6KM97_9RHOB|nr:hypothetical protein C8N45_102354 [Yoonia sediminilitoris]RCW97637.1 hypothetical protein DFP92_102354 [Yoonia sediminilitoris]